MSLPDTDDAALFEVCKMVEAGALKPSCQRMVLVLTFIVERSTPCLLELSIFCHHFV